MVERGTPYGGPKAVRGQDAETILVATLGGGGGGLRYMIRNDQEREVASGRLAELDAEIEELAGRPLGAASPSGSIADLVGQAEDLRAQVNRYEQLKAGEITHFEVEDLAMFGEALVEARVARGMEEGRLAAAVDVSPEEIERYERNRYRDAPFQLVSEVVLVLAEEVDLRLRLPAPEKAGPWSVLEEISNGRPVTMVGQGTLTLQPDQQDADDPLPRGPGLVNVKLLYHPASGGDLNVRLGLVGQDAAGTEILSWRPKDEKERTIPRYNFSGEVDAPNGRVRARMAPVYVDFRNDLGRLGLLLDSAHELSVGPGSSSAPERLRALVPNLHAYVDGEADGLSFSLRPTGEVQPDGPFPGQVGKILPGSFLELERSGGGETSLEEAVVAFGWFLSFYAGRAVHPVAWEAETPDGPFCTIQSLRQPSPRPDKFRRTCLPLNVLGPFLTQAWCNWVEFGAEERKRLQGVVNTYEAILATRYPIVQIALTAMYLERLRDHVLGSSELIELGSGKKKNVAKELRDALVAAIESNSKLELHQTEILKQSLAGNSVKVFGLFRKSFKESLLELHEKADLPVDAGRVGEFIRQRDLVLHGSWDASEAGTVDTYWVARYGTWLLERLVLRRFGYEGVYWNRVRQVSERMTRGTPSWGDGEGAERSGDT